jgi:ABC-type lipoprotein export system ATPase subunit
MAEEVQFLKLTAVSKEYDSVLGAPPVRVIDNVHLELNRGDSAAIVGASGSGKSTLLNIIGTLDVPTSGTVFLEGQDLCKLDEDGLSTLRNRRIGLVFQAHHLLPQCTVLENVLMPTLAVREETWRQNAEIRSKRLLERVGLGQRMDHRPDQLSGGERQRVAVVRALVNQPSLLLADEPTGALDRTAADGLAQLLLDLNREEKVTLIVVTHAPELAARMSRQFHLSDGHLHEITSKR